MSEETKSEPEASHEMKARAEGLVGSTLSQRYRIDALLAFGGMGAVYKGEHVLMRKRIAIKVLQPGSQDLPRLVERFRREAIVGAHVSHPNIASATDFGQLDDGSYFLIMELIKGRTLYDLLQEEGALPVDRAMGIARQVAAGLFAAHEAGVIHRDIKPHNVMLVDLDGNRTASIPALLLGRDIIKIIDFGFASLATERLSMLPSERPSMVPERITLQGEIFGTIAYLAPEAAGGMDAVDARSDLYALGVVMYQMLTGLHPFTETSPGRLFRCHLATPPPPFAQRAPSVSVPPEVEALTLRLLEKDPTLRFQSAAELIQAIDVAMGLAPPVPRIPTAPLPDDLLRSAFHQEAAAALRDERSSPALPIPLDPPGASTPTASTSTTSTTSTSLLPPQAPPSRGWVGGALLGLGIALASFALAWTQGWLHLRPASTPDGVKVDTIQAPAVSPVFSASSASAGASASGSAPQGPEPAGGPAAAASEAAAAGSARPSVELGPWKVRLKSSVQVRDWPNARLSFRKVAEASPEALAEPTLLPTAVDLLTNVGQHHDAEAEELFGLLERGGPGGLDVLYDLVQRRGGTLAAERATEILKKPGVLGRASGPMRVAFELRQAPCSEKGALLERLVTEGDWRAVGALDAARSACGSSRGFEEARRKLASRVGR